MIRGVILRYTTYTHNLSCSAHARLFSVFFWHSTKVSSMQSSVMISVMHLQPCSARSRGG